MLGFWQNRWRNFRFSIFSPRVILLWPLRVLISTVRWISLLQQFKLTVYKLCNYVQQIWNYLARIFCLVLIWIELSGLDQFEKSWNIDTSAWCLRTQPLRSSSSMKRTGGLFHDEIYKQIIGFKFNLKQQYSQSQKAVEPYLSYPRESRCY